MEGDNDRPGSQPNDVNLSFDSATTVVDEGDIYSGDGHLRGLFDGSSDDMVEDLTGSSSDARPGPVPSAVCDLASNRGKEASLNGPSRSTASSSSSTTAGDGDFGGGNGHYPMYSSARFSSNNTDASGRYQGTAAPFTPQPMGSMGHVSAGCNGGGGTRNGPPTDFGPGASIQPWVSLADYHAMCSAQWPSHQVLGAQGQHSGQTGANASYGPGASSFHPSVGASSFDSLPAGLTPYGTAQSAPGGPPAAPLSSASSFGIAPAIAHSAGGANAFAASAGVAAVAPFAGPAIAVPSPAVAPPAAPAVAPPPAPAVPPPPAAALAPPAAAAVAAPANNPAAQGVHGKDDMVGFKCSIVVPCELPAQ